MTIPLVGRHGLATYEPLGRTPMVPIVLPVGSSPTITAPVVDSRLSLPPSSRCTKKGCESLRIIGPVNITAPPILTMECHCTGCQKMSASAFALTAMMPANGIAVISGDPAIGGLHGNPKHYFCPHCMSWMYTKPDGMPFTFLRPTMLDDPSWFSPFIETMTSEKFPWATTGALHRFEKSPPMDEFANLAKLYREHRGSS